MNKENIKKYAEVILKYSALFPLFIGLCYFIGFICFSSHLSSYGISESNILNLEYLKTGLLYCFFLISLGIIFFKFSGPISEFRTEMKREQESWVVLNDLFYYSGVLSFVITG